MSAIRAGSMWCHRKYDFDALVIRVTRTTVAALVANHKTLDALRMRPRDFLEHYKLVADPWDGEGTMAALPKAAVRLLRAGRRR
jgi:hypothetical protein